MATSSMTEESSFDLDSSTSMSIKNPPKAYEEYIASSVDEIDTNVFLGNLTAACDLNTLERLKITHILTIDSVPLPRTALERSHLNMKYIKLADVPKEDMISHFPEINEFIMDGQKNGAILVHCYFGMSRSATAVLAFLMSKYGLCYEDALRIAKAKRRVVCPNAGFVAQLKLFGQMGCVLNREDPRYRQFRLKMAGQKLKEIKILPQVFADLVKTDPGLIRERPDPLVYRCKKCRRIVASQSNLIPHMPKPLKIELAKRNLKPSKCNMTCVQNGQILIEKLKNLSCQTGEENGSSGLDESSRETSIGSVINLDEDLVGNVDTSVVARTDAGEACKQVYFVEPMNWMSGVQHQMQGKLYCPKCANKIGSFSWVMGCQCPCGQKVAPAFYLVPSKVEWSNVVQNVQTTV